MPKTITVTVGADGGVQIETKGFKGAECENATKELERALGRVKSNKRTEEFHRQPDVLARTGR